MDKRHSPPMSRQAVQRGLPASLREPGPFRLLFWGQALSVIGDRITPVAIAFAVLGLGSATDLGLVMAAGGVPFALFALAGGVWADRAGRRRVMIASDIARGLSQALVATLLLTGTAEVWMLAALSFVYGTSAAVFMPALVGLIPQTVGAPRLQEANALLALTRSLANVAGPALAGVLVAVAGPGEAIAVDAATFAVSALCLLRLRPSAAMDDADASAEEPEPFLAGLRGGWREVRSRAWLSWGLVAMSSYHVFVLPAVFVLGPALAERELDGASSWATIVACFGVGSIIGNVLAMRLPLPRPVFMAAVALVGASTQAVIIGSGLGTAGIAALELLAGICVALFFTLWDLSIQEQIPPRAESRVSA
jgi:MFS family permease